MSSPAPVGAPPPPPPLPEDRIRPSAWWFLAAAGIASTGIVAGIVVFVVGVMQMYEQIDGFARAAVPGTFDVEIHEPGGYTVYQEHDRDGDPWSVVTLVDIVDPSEEPVAVIPYTSDITYSRGRDEGRALYSFRADRAGTYTVETTGDPGSTVAVGRGLDDGLTRSFLLAGALGLAGVAGGVVTAIVVGVRRSRARRSLWALPPSPGAPPPGWGGPPPGWAGPPPATD